jgi:multimeric flavodoxin WrbA
MKVIVLNGSPKGMTSITMQYVHYIEQLYPQHDFQFIDISVRLPKLERDVSAFGEVIETVRSAEAIIWASPVYYWLIPANYKRFIELISEREVEDAFRDKYTIFLSTSIHFFDHTAHNYLQGICEDLEMNYLGSYSADMSDLLKPEERKRLEQFCAGFLNDIEQQVDTTRIHMPLTVNAFDYHPEPPPLPLETGKHKILLLTDQEDGQLNLQRMVSHVCDTFSGDVEVINLHDLDIKGACLGCLHCAWDNRCVYEGKDEYVDFFNDKIAGADILIWAGAIRDRYLSATWKQFFDRSFFKGHVPSLMGKQVGFIVSGPLAQLPNLRQILEAYVEIQQANLAGIVTDEESESTHIDQQLNQLCGQLLRSSADGYIHSPSFLGVGGRLLFRDHVYGKMRFPFRADYLAYKRLGVFDFPQKRYKRRLMNSVMLLLSHLPGFRKEINRRMKEEMIKPLQRVLERTKI